MAPKRKTTDPNASKYLLFIDTNIWLDFYRVEASDQMLEALPLITHARDRLISTAQVQMEFMKNRQTVLIQALEKFKPAEDVRLPPIIADAAAARTIKSARTAMESRRKLLKARVERILKNPATNDPVYRALQDIFLTPTATVLGRENEQRFAIRRLARKRWLLGYPPRKDDDLSVGDAINWEWLIECAKSSSKHVIIVSRDQDYGRTYNGHTYLNDWLRKEYAERVGRRGNIVLTNALHAALRLMNVTVPPAVVRAEIDLIKKLPATSSITGTVGDAPANLSGSPSPNPTTLLPPAS